MDEQSHSPTQDPEKCTPSGHAQLHGAFNECIPERRVMGEIQNQPCVMNKSSALGR